MKVRNKRVVRRLAFAKMCGMRARNTAAVCAIALTSLLFTAVFTIAMCITDGIQESEFRRIGTYAHGEFKRLTAEQCGEFEGSSELAQTGRRLLAGVSDEGAFSKLNVEVSWCDENVAKWNYLTPEQGSLPAEGTNEAAADTQVLKALGVTPALGSEFTVSYDVNGENVTRTYVLSGWWEADELAAANHILVAKSEAESVTADAEPDTLLGRYCGLYDLYFMVDDVNDVEQIQKDILGRYGYQNEQTGSASYISCAVNEMYAQRQLSDTDSSVFLAIGGLVLLIIFTGYLVINNIFSISTANDVREYGLLRTIGTTGRQIRSMVRTEAFALAGIGIPVGLLLGYVFGAVLAPAIVDTLSGVSVVTSASPVIFVFSAAFGLLTVWLSCMKPARIASKASPLEALRHVEGRGVMGRGRKLRTMISLMLAVVLLDVTVSLAGSFDMDKYLSDVNFDEIIAYPNYFNSSGHLFGSDYAVDPQVIENMNDTGMVESGGITYATGSDDCVYEYVPENVYEDKLSEYEAEYQDMYRENTVWSDDMAQTGIQLYGMEDYELSRLTCISGDLSGLGEGTGYIAAVSITDDEGEIYRESWADVGDTVKIRYVDSYEWYDLDTGEIYSDEELLELSAETNVGRRDLTYHEVTYTVCAVVSVPSKLSYRYYMNDQFVLSADELLAEYPQANIMYYACDVKDGSEADMEVFMEDYTENVMTEYSYESRQTYEDELDGTRRMFTLLGMALSFVTGLTGVVNYVNMMVTSACSRRREFAVLQAVGMTGRQLRRKLIGEGMQYAFGSVALAGALLLVLCVPAKRAAESALWFVTYHTKVLPILCVLPVFALMGFAVPLVIYVRGRKVTVVERLREL